MKRTSVETEIDSFLAKYSPAVAAELRSVREKLRALFPQGYELVYDNYNALVFGFSPSERPSDAVVSIAGYPKWVNLFFLKGADLKDPKHLLQGTGTTVRSIRFVSTSFEQPEVLALIERAAKPFRSAFKAAPPLCTIIKSVSKKQRPRRPVIKT